MISENDPRSRAGKPHSGRSGGVVRMPRTRPSRPRSAGSRRLAQIDRGKVRILDFKYLRHSDMASVLITAFEIFTGVSPDNSFEGFTECSIGIVSDQPSDVYELLVTLLE